MLSLANGYSTDYLTNAVRGGREGYYTGAVAAGEPPGLWHGQGAAELGLAGEVETELMEALYGALLDPRDPAAHSRATWGQAAPLAVGHRAYRSAEDIYADLLEREPEAGPERRAELQTRAERSARQAVSFLDATFSAPKSVSVLGVAFERAANEARAVEDLEAAALWERRHQALEAAVLAGARASTDYLQDVAGYSRVGHHGGGAGRWIDAHQFVIAQFLQHDSRDRDPQLHVHQAILNRALSADGTWRALDSRAIHTWRGAAGAIGERVMEAHLSRELGVRFETRPDGKAREIVGVSQHVMELFSSRRRAISAKAEQLIEAYRDHHGGREPSALERTHIFHHATLATRKAKSHDGESLEERLDRWEAETRALVAGGLAQVAHDALAGGEGDVRSFRWDERDVIDWALAAIGDTKQAWSRSDLMRAISDALPGQLDLAPERVRTLFEGLTDIALIDAVRLSAEESADGLTSDLLLANGASAYATPGGARYATRGQLAADAALREATVERGAPTFTAEQADALVNRFAKSGVELGADQATALRGVLTSGARLEVLAAAAGTGKSFTVGVLGEAWAQAGMSVVALATSQIATEVLAEEGLTARNVSMWLDIQRRLETGCSGGDDESFRLRGGELVVLDEASMTSTADLLKVHQRCHAAGAKLLLVGDPQQLAAVGPGGALADVAQHGIRYELTETRRFSADWEGPASLRLREGDVAGLEDYQRHGRLVDGGTREDTHTTAGRQWLADTLSGRDSVLLVGTNDDAARVSAALRAQLVALGRVGEEGVSLGLQGTIAGVGDLVQARRNGWELIGRHNNEFAPINRATYTVTSVREDGGLTVTPVRGRVGESLHLPSGYVAEHLALGYASTVHAAQGRTVDTAHAVITPGMDAAAAYVALTRGRDGNTAYAVTQTLPDDPLTDDKDDIKARSARAVLGDILTRDDIADSEAELSALALADHQADAARSVQRSLDRLATEIDLATTGRTTKTLDRLTAGGVLSPADRAALAADQESLASLERLLRTAEVAGHSPTQVLETAVAERDLEGARHPARVLYSRIRGNLQGQLTPRVAKYADLIPAEVPPQRRERLEALASAADERRRELGARLVTEAPQWLREALGPVPEDELGRASYGYRAGWAGAYRELAGHTSDTDPLGDAPPRGLGAHYAAWHAAHAALQLPEAGAEEAEASDGQLRARVRALQREENWAPIYVGDQLDALHQGAASARADAVLGSAQAEAATDETVRAELLAAAARARTEAETLAERAAALEPADNTRGQWFVETAITRDKAHRARAELGRRGVNVDDPEAATSSAEWLALHDAEQVIDEAYRRIREEAELSDEPTEEDREAAEHLFPVAGEPVPETGVPDIRETTRPDASEHDPAAHPQAVPDQGWTTRAVARAHNAVPELLARHQVDEARETEEIRRRQLSHWAQDDHATEQAGHDNAALQP